MFLTPLVIKAERGKKFYELQEQLIYSTPSGDGYIVVPKGFRTNFASIPRILKAFVDDNGPVIRDASVVHDYLYSLACPYSITRKKADQVLRDGMKDLGASWWKRQMVYWAVRSAGWSFYKK